MTDYLTAPPSEQGPQRGSEQAPSTQTPPASSDTPTGTPAGQAGRPELAANPLANYQEIFAEEPRLLPYLKETLGGDEHTIARTLQQADTFYTQHLTTQEQALLKRDLGGGRTLGNDPAIIQALARFGQERMGMEKTIADFQQQVARLQDNPGVWPVPAPTGPPERGSTSAGLSERDTLRQQEWELARQHSASRDPDERQLIQKRLSAVQKALYA